MSYASIDDLRSQLGASAKPALTPEYRAKQLHDIPTAPVVQRNEFILKDVTGKRVLEFGASGALSLEIRKVASQYQGVDRHDSDQVIGYDLDDVEHDVLPTADADVIVCGEVLEHLGNPLFFLKRLRAQYKGVPVIITVPNAMAAGSKSWLEKGIENCNREHVAYYSWVTLKELVTRVGYEIEGFAWYGGQPKTSEGLIFVVR